MAGVPAVADGKTGASAATALDDDEALTERLAERLHRTLERLEAGGSEWVALSSYEREFYRTCAENLLRRVQRAYIERG